MNEKEFQKIDDKTNEVMDRIRELTGLNPESNADDEIYGIIQQLVIEAD
jgi:uncharacterized protein YdcH (DUF465 family)